MGLPSDHRCREFVDQAARKRPRKPQPSERATWFEGCVVDDRDRIIPNLANVLVALWDAPQSRTPLPSTPCSRRRSSPRRCPSPKTERARVPIGLP